VARDRTGQRDRERAKRAADIAELVNGGVPVKQARAAVYGKRADSTVPSMRQVRAKAAREEVPPASAFKGLQVKEFIERAVHPRGGAAHPSERVWDHDGVGEFRSASVVDGIRLIEACADADRRVAVIVDYSDGHSVLVTGKTSGAPGYAYMPARQVVDMIRAMANIDPTQKITAAVFASVSTHLYSRDMSQSEAPKRPPRITSIWISVK
jgi:hypothetical protein